MAVSLKRSTAPSVAPASSTAPAWEVSPGGDPITVDGVTLAVVRKPAIGTAGEGEPGKPGHKPASSDYKPAGDDTLARRNSAGVYKPTSKVDDIARAIVGELLA